MFGRGQGVTCSVGDIGPPAPLLDGNLESTGGTAALLTGLLTNSLCKRFSFTCLSFQ